MFQSGRGALGWLSLVVGCAAAAPSEKVVKAPSSELAGTAGCSSAGAEQEAASALKAGNVLAARRLAQRAAGACDPATSPVLREVNTLFQVDHVVTTDALLAEAAQARSSGQLEQARKREARAVHQLERQWGSGLRLRQRWALQGLFSERDSRKDDHSVTNPRFKFLRDGSEIQILDTQTGHLRTRITLPQSRRRGGQLHIEVSPTGRRVVLRTIDLDFINATAGERCLSKLHFYDGDSGKLLKEDCAMRWEFTPDGSRLLLARLFEPRPGQVAARELVVFETESLQPLYQVTPPKSEHGESNAESLHVAANGRAFAVQWSNGVTVTDLSSGRSEAFALNVRNVANSPQFGGDRVTWLAEGKAFSWSLSAQRLTSWTLGQPTRCTNAALSEDGSHLAVDCEDFVEIYHVATRRRTAMARSSSGRRVYKLKWLAGGRHLAVLLDGPARGEWALLDAKGGRWIALGGPGESVRQFRAEERLALVRSNSRGKTEHERLVYVDLLGVPREIPSGDCTPHEIGRGSQSTAVAACRGIDQLGALLIDRKTLQVSTRWVGGDTVSVFGNKLIAAGDATFEIRDLATGLNENSPVGPAATRTDGFWDDTRFVSRALIGADEHYRVNDFSPRLRTVSEPVVAEGSCANGDQRGKWAWSTQHSPAAICERRSGRRVAEVSAELVGKSSFARLDINEDRQLALPSAHEPRVVRLSSGASVELQGSPLHVQFASGDLVFGFDAQGGWGMWSGDTGQRLVRSREAIGDSIILANEELGVLVEGGRRPKVRNYHDGTLRAELPVDARGEVTLTRNGVLSVVEGSRVSFWNVRSGQRIGQLLQHPNTAESAFLAESGEFETSADPRSFLDLLRCEVGLKELPFEICVDAWFEPGVAQRSLAR